MVAAPQFRDGESCGGYVLIDVIATLAIAGLLLMLAQPNFARTTSPTGLHALLTRIVATLKDVRSSAMLQNTPVAAVFDGRMRTVSAGTEVISLPRDLDVRVVSGEACRSNGQRVEFVFRGDGTNCGGILRFAKDKWVFRIRVNWLTGHVEIIKGD
jgi:general secretion pathway protein H